MYPVTVPVEAHRRFVFVRTSERIGSVLFKSWQDLALLDTGDKSDAGSWPWHVDVSHVQGVGMSPSAIHLVADD